MSKKYHWGTEFMHHKEIFNPSDLSEALMDIFPDLRQLWAQPGELEAEDTQSFHSVWMVFAPHSYKLLHEATPNEIKRFSSLIDYMVSRGGDLENAVSTCFLEHASQLSVRKLLKPHLSRESKHELR